MTSQLIAQTNARVEVVDKNPGASHDPAGILGRLERLGVDALAVTDSDECIADYVAVRVGRAIAGLASSQAFIALEHESADVVVAIPNDYVSPFPAELCVLAWDSDALIFRPFAIDRMRMHGSEMPVRELVFNGLPPGSYRLEDFLTAQRLRELASRGEPVVYEDPRTGDRLALICAERIMIDRWELLKVDGVVLRA